MVGSKDAVIEPGADDRVVDVRDDDIDGDSITYGRWHEEKDGKFIVPGRISGSDYSGSLVERSNHRKFGEEFGDGLGKWWYETRGGHGTFGVVVDMTKVPGDISEDVANFLNGLQEYGLADEELNSQMESEAQDEAWDDWAKRDFQRALERRFDVDLDDVDGEKLFEIFHEAAERSNTYWVNEQGDSMYIDLDRVIKATSKKDVDFLFEGGEWKRG